MTPGASGESAPVTAQWVRAKARDAESDGLAGWGQSRWKPAGTPESRLSTDQAERGKSVEDRVHNRLRSVQKLWSAPEHQP